MEVINSFISASMDKDSDIRVLSPTEYIHAENFDVATTTEGRGTAVEDLGTVLKSTGGIAPDGGDQVVGAFNDSKRNLVYYFVYNAGAGHKVVEYNPTGVSRVIIKGINLAFNSPSNLITSVVKVYNDDINDDLLIWTDGINPIRQINIERASNYTVNGFTDDQINLIKAAPKDAPVLEFIDADDNTENNLEGSFIQASCRYIYLDGQVSAMSPFTAPIFAPNDFELDSTGVVNKGMVNKYKGAVIRVNTGSSEVSKVELLVKESGSNTVFIADEVSKANTQDNYNYPFTFLNDGVYTPLPADQLGRTYDNVPVVAKALDLAGSRLVMANYQDTRDLKDSSNNKITPDLTASLIVAGRSGGSELTISVVSGSLTIDFTGADLNTGDDMELLLNVQLNPTQVYPTGIVSGTGSYFFTASYDTVSDFFTGGFEGWLENFINTLNLVTLDWDSNDGVEEITQIEAAYVGTASVATLASDVVTATPPVLRANTVVEEQGEQGQQVLQTCITTFSDETTGSLQVITGSISTTTGLKSGIPLSVGIVYKDGFGRATPVLTSATATATPGASSAYQATQVKVSIANKPPAWATHYNLVVKHAALGHQTIYLGNGVKAEDGSVYFKLEGDNVNKVREGDTLIVKSDSSGPLSKKVTVEVGKVGAYAEDITDVSGGTVTLSGTYANMTPNGFYVKEGISNESTYGFKADAGNAKLTTTPETSGAIDDGDSVLVDIKCYREGPDGFDHSFYKTYYAGQDYSELKTFFEGVVMVDAAWTSFEGNLLYTAAHEIFPAGKENKFTNGSAVEGTELYPVTFEVNISRSSSKGSLIFETENPNQEQDLYYEVGRTFPITNNLHGGDTAQTLTTPATVTMEYYNCYLQGNGAESYRIQDKFSARKFNNDVRAWSTIDGEYKKVVRYADMTYSEPYNESSGINRLNEFNLYNANFKDDIEKSFGPINYIMARDTDILIWQDDKVSKILFGKDMLSYADGGSNLSQVPYVLGQQVTYAGDYGSKNPESIARFMNYIYFFDKERKRVLRLAGDGINDITSGMVTWFSDACNTGVPYFKGEVDPVTGRYVASLAVGVQAEGFVGDYYTLKFDEDSYRSNRRGWVSFYGFIPEMMSRVLGRFVSFKNGALYEHTDKSDRNNFYGTYYAPTIKYPVVSPDKLSTVTFKSLEVNASVEPTVTLDVIGQDGLNEFSVGVYPMELREGIYEAPFKRSAEAVGDNLYGIGNITSKEGNVLTVTKLPSRVNDQDQIISSSGAVATSIVSTSGNTITVADASSLAVGAYIAGASASGIEGKQARGFGGVCTLTFAEGTEATRLSSVKTTIVPSQT